MVSAPLARVPKRNPDRTLSERGRLVWDARKVNHYCLKESHPPALQPRHDELVRLILWWGSRFPGLRILLAKKDTAEAFKWVPVRVEDARFFAADLPGSEFGLAGDLTAVYRVLTFGFRGAPGQYMLFAATIREAFNSHAPTEGSWNDTTPFCTMVLMDDSVLVEPDVGLRPFLAAELLESITRVVLGPQAINEEKDREEGQYSPSQIIWGLAYDTERQSRSLPAPKLEKAAHLLALPDFNRGNRCVQLSLVQELRGNQQFWLSALPVLSSLLGASNALLGPPSPAGDAVPKGDTPSERERLWVRFWDAVEVQRYLVEVREEWATTFTHPMVSALSFTEMLALPQVRSKIVWASGDATLDRVAAIDWTFGQAFSLETDAFRPPLLSFVREALATSHEEREGAEELAFEPGVPEQFIVSVTELLAVVALAAARGPAWRGRLVAYAGDNQTVGSWLRKRHTHRAVPAFLLQFLTVLEAVYGFRVHFAYIRTYHNTTADALTRNDSPPQLMEEKGLSNLEGVEGFLLRLLSRGWLKRAFLWTAQRDVARDVALQLALHRSGTPLPGAMEGTFEEPLLHLKVAEWRPGLAKYSCGFAALGAEVVLQGGPPPAGSVFRREDQDEVHLFLCSLVPHTVDPADVARGALRARARALWADTLLGATAARLRKHLQDSGEWEVTCTLCSGRSLGQEVWWKRWVVTAVRKPAPALGCGIKPVDEEPSTPPGQFEAEWLRRAPEDSWLYDGIKMDNMPYLGSATPKPAALRFADKGRQFAVAPGASLPGSSCR